MSNPAEFIGGLGAILALASFPALTLGGALMATGDEREGKPVVYLGVGGMALGAIVTVVASLFLP